MRARAAGVRARWSYLVVGCGAMGMGFADVLVAETNATLVMVDRHHAPGGHWNDAYPFVRLHQPATYYGVNYDRVMQHGLLVGAREANESHEEIARELGITVTASEKRIAHMRDSFTHRVDEEGMSHPKREKG